MRRQQQVLEYFPKIWDFILPQTGLLRSTLGPSDLGPGGRSYNGPISCLHCVLAIPEYDLNFLHDGSIFIWSSINVVNWYWVWQGAGLQLVLLGKGSVDKHPCHI